MSGPPILVTGSHRSGTTFVGRMLALADDTHYVHEPFNPAVCPGWLAPPVPHWFLYVDEQHARPYARQVDRVMRLRFPIRHQRMAASPRAFARMGRDAMQARAARRAGARPIVKDPLMLLSAPWVARRYDAPVVVCMRHPAGVVSSLLRLNWRFDVHEWLAQPALMAGPLKPYQGWLSAAAADPPGALDEAVLVWRVLAAVTCAHLADHPEWLLVRHEDLAFDPTAVLRRLFKDVGLTWDDRVAGQVLSFTTSGSSDVGAREVHRDSAAAAQAWRSRLTGEQVARIRELAGEQGARFYPLESDWI